MVGKRILLAEDEPGVREALQLLLSVDRHEVTVAKNGKEALDLYRPHAFDLVITDFAMPEMQGDELAARIRKQAPCQPILMATAYAEDLGRSRRRVDAVIGKPVGFSDLRRIMAEILLRVACGRPLGQAN